MNAAIYLSTLWFVLALALILRTIYILLTVWLVTS